MARRSFFNSHNPFMSEKAYRNSSQEVTNGDVAGPITTTERMTVQGAINKSFILFGILLVTTIVSYTNPHPVFMWGGAIGGLIVVFVAAFKPHL